VRGHEPLRDKEGAADDDPRGDDRAAADPGAAFADDTDCGLYRIGADNWGLAVGGAAHTVLGATTLAVLADTDATVTLGRAKIGSPTTDEATFAHVDKLASTTYILKGTAAGTATTLNVATGGTITLAVNNAAIGTVAATGLTLASGKTLTVASDEDVTTVLGRCKFGSPASDAMYLSHFDRLTVNNYALRQTASGTTTLSGSSLNLAVSNVNKLSASSTEVTSSVSLVADQASTTGAKPSLKLDQADVSEEFIRFVGESAADNSQSLVDAADLTTPGAIVGWARVYVEDVAGAGDITDGIYFIPFYATPTA
jgi:hypothetical protein